MNTPRSTPTVADDAGPEFVTVARQPIYTRSMTVTAYELLYRSAGGGGMAVGDTVATSTVLSNGLMWIGLEALVPNRPAYVNFGRELLLSDRILKLPPQRIVIEVLETVEPDAEIIEALKTLHHRGFKLALDDFVWEPGREVLLPLVDVVKLDFGAIAPEARADAVQRVRALRFAAPPRPG
jgi:EAL and modified HD-GYP domain-containing signal transduction protein